MCMGPELLAIASLGATGASAYSQHRALRAQEEEANRRMEAERLRQRALQQESDARVRQGLAVFTPERQREAVQTEAATRSAAFAPPMAPMPEYRPGTVAAPVEVKTDADRRIGDALARGAEEAQRRAQLSAFGAVSGDESRSLGRLGEDVGRIKGFSRGSTALVPADIKGSASAGEKWGTAATLFDTLGRVGNAYAMGMKPPPPTGGTINPLDHYTAGGTGPY